MKKTWGRSRFKRRLVLATAGVLAAGALGACAANPSDGESGGEAPARTVGPGQAQAGEEVDLLKVGIPGQIATLDPNKDIAAGLYANSLGLETLLRLDQEGNLEPWLATDWEVTDGRVFTYTLREGVKFWNGSEFTSDDVKFAWELQADAGQPFFASIESIEAPDPLTVVVTHTEPNASWQYTPALFYSFVYEKEFYESNPDEFGMPGRLVMGTGPWKFDRLSPTDGMELSAFSDYWGGKPPIKRISVKSFADENSMALAMRAGEIDIAPLVSQPKGFNAAAGNSMTTTVPTCAIALLGMPTETAPFDDVHVRRAVAHALDRQDIIAAKQGAAGLPVETLFPPSVLESLGSAEEVSEALDEVPSYEFDLEKAKAELAQSSVPEGFEFEFLTTSASGPVAQVIAAQLSEIGIRIKVNSVGDTEYISRLIDTKDRPLTYSETGACNPDPSWNDIWLGTKPDGSPSTLNFANYTPPEVDDLLHRGRTTTDPSDRLEIYAEILGMLGQDVPYVPLYTEGATYASADYELYDFGAYWMNQPWALNLVTK